MNALNGATSKYISEFLNYRAHSRSLQSVSKKLLVQPEAPTSG